LKWVIDLSPSVINYELRRAIKAQALTALIIKCLVLDELKQRITSLECYTLIDRQPIKFMLKASVNETEYVALLAGIEIAMYWGQNTLKHFPTANLWRVK